MGAIKAGKESLRYLIVNADDFGRSPGVNDGVIEAHERGIATSASLMVRWSAAEEAAQYGRAHPELSLGLHVDLGEWEYRDERWAPVYEVVSLSDTAAVGSEITRQLESYRRMVGGNPTHLDSHQHVHLSDPVRSIMLGLAADLRVPLRDCSPLVRYHGGFYGQTGKGDPLPEAICVEAFCNIITGLPTGITEIGCHPGKAIDFDTTYANEREEEVKALCDPRLKAFLATDSARLVSFRDIVESVGFPCPDHESLKSEC